LTNLFTQCYNGAQKPMMEE